MPASLNDGGSLSAKNAVSACMVVQPGVVIVQQMSAAAVGRSLAATDQLRHGWWSMHTGGYMVDTVFEIEPRCYRWAVGTVIEGERERERDREKEGEAIPS